MEKPNEKSTKVKKTSDLVEKKQSGSKKTTTKKASVIEKAVSSKKNTDLSAEATNKKSADFTATTNDAKPTANTIKIWYVVSECQPFCATGGLADVAGSLPTFIAQHSNIDIRVVLPLYSDITAKYRDRFTFVGSTNINVSWRSLYCGVFSYYMNGVTYYFIDNEYYFKRSGGIYSYYDDGERYAFMSRASLDILKMIDFKPDIIHGNDWQSALVPIYIKTHPDYKYLENVKTVFTLHNTEYQGKFDMAILGDVFGLDTRHKGIVEYNGAINLVKGAIVCCDKFSTVSPTYAQEILSPEYSNGLDAILRENQYKICGILNGIDYDFYNPKTDEAIFKNYDIDTFEDRYENKTELQKMFGLNVDPEVPMISIVSRMAKHKGMDLIKDGIEQILAKRVQLVIVGNGEAIYEKYFEYLEQKYKGKVKAAIGYSNTLARKAYAASDIFIMPSKSEPCGLSQMIASRYGSLPIVRETGGLKDSIKDFGCAGGGNGYTFSNYNTHDLLYSINRALNDYENKDAWKEKIKICMSSDFSWKSSATVYVKMYEELL